MQATPSVTATKISDAVPSFMPVISTPSATSTVVVEPTASATPISIAAAVPSATPVAAVPTPSTTPVAVPSATPPLQVYSTPARVAQGHVTVLWVSLNFEGNISGNIAGRPIEWGLSDTGPGLYWSILGFAANSPVGIRNVNITAKDRQGGEHKVTYQLEVVPGGFPVESIWIPPSQGGLLDSGVMTNEKQRVVGITSVVNPKRLWDGPLIYPAQAEISSRYGTGRSYNGGPVSDHHGGVDFDVDVGTPIVSSATGVVVLAEPLMVRGNAVLIDHGMGIFSGYYHLSQINVTVGQKIGKGGIIGLSGVTGLATGPHLHWDVIVRGTNVNGIEWVERRIP